MVIPVEPGGSVLGALKALKALPKAEKALICEVLVAEGRNPSRQRNLAVAGAKGEFIHFMDSDSRLAPGALPRLLKAAQPAQVAAVGGPNVVPDNESPTGQAFDWILGSYLGSFRSAARYRAIGGRRDCTEKELILCNLLFRRDAYLALGGLREDLYPNEENELFNRVLARGLRLIYEPQAKVRRPRRQTLSAFAYQAFRYGRGRMQQMRTAFHVSDLVNLAPLLLLLGTLLGLSWFVVPGRGFFWPVLQQLGLAGALLFVTAVLSEFRPLQHKRLGTLILGYFLRHYAYGTGLLSGLFQGPSPRPLDVNLRRERW